MEKFSCSRGRFLRRSQLWQEATRTRATPWSGCGPARRCQGIEVCVQSSHAKHAMIEDVIRCPSV
eukprot:1150264-Pelagomonas_calceolata.AAC.4